MNTEIIAVGSELLLGQIANTNAQYLSQQLAHLGVDVHYHSVVGDNPHRLRYVFDNACQRADLVILMGGLGPTKDDLTKETVASVIGRKLVEDEQTLQSIHEHFAQRQQTMTDNNRKQALVIEGADVFANHHGLACGMAVHEGKNHIHLLPGPPQELKPMVEQYMIPYLLEQKFAEEAIVSRVLRFFDIGESQLVDLIDEELEAQTNPTIAPLASDGEVTVRLTVKSADSSEQKRLLDETEEKILKKLSPYFYGYGNDTLVERVKDSLQKQSLTLSVAESLTGGAFANMLMTVPGVSNVFAGSITAYTNHIKERVLGVAPTIIQSDGAVSESCAKAMAEQVRECFQSDVGISFTGVAGPESLEGKMPGTVYIGVASESSCECYMINLAGSREQIRKRASKYGLYYVLKQFEKVER
ncbi:competence/damage-inducible protein A [Texcoconibacillus texcoconensis]|uniref:Putative competence-damage inducible protein n=1 Tax=Texcoconibacillus texcoconensis TaxID=1095777 RepID=A0A840QIS8_9BACI|nr:competence/damage-inducible protein A [Texcoconibacillus texcoconensis]MBB5172005.1 nicotinamide-nucleotide amidase [Texcoconibacillus texcoconensis]